MRPEDPLNSNPGENSALPPQTEVSASAQGATPGSATRPDLNGTKTIKVSGYQLSVRHRQQRETLVFASIGGTMTVLLIFSVLVLFGIIPIPFLNSFNAAPKIANSGDVPCTLSSTPVSPGNITATVVNGASTSGLAKDVADNLAARDIKIKSVGNSQDKYDGAIEITTGPAGVNAAYTLARAFKESEIIMDTRPTNDVTVTIGTQYTEMVSATDFTEAATQPLEDREGCHTVSTD